MMDTANAIYEAVYSMLEREVQPNGLFERFKLYKDEPIRQGIVFPCLMLVKEDLMEDRAFFSDEGVRILQLDIHLAFGSRNSFLREGEETFNAESMVYRYISRLDEFYEKIDLSDQFNIENILRRVEPVFPLNPKTEQYGCIYSISIYYVR